MNTHRIILLFLLLSSSFISKADTVDNYQIYINNILVRNDSGLPRNFITLDKSVSNSTIDVYLNHCTGGAKNRRIVIFSKGKSRVIGWQFQDEEIVRLMSISIHRLWEKIKDNDTYEMYYYDDQTTEGRFLTSFKILR